MPTPRAPWPLRDYQLEAIEFAEQRHGAAFFQDLGLGKTAQIIYGGTLPAVVVVPTSAIHVWLKEAQRAGVEAQVLQGLSASPQKISREVGLHVVTYGSAAAWLPLFGRWASCPRIRTLVADEAHHLHKMGSRWSRALSQCKRDRTIVLTATPARNRLRSLHGLLHAIAPTAFGDGEAHRSLIEFRRRYCGAEQDSYGHLVDGPELTHAEELAARLTEVAIAETWLSPRVQHLRPQNHRQTIRVDLSYDERVDYLNSCLERAFSKLGATTSTNQISYLTAQRIELGKLKAHWLVSSGVLDRLVDRHRRLIVWCWHKEVADILREGLGRYGRPLDVVTGDAPTRKRSSILEEWEEGDHTEPRHLLATMGALSTAVNLTTAEAAVYVEYSWAPLDLQQSEARHHRPGSKFKDVYTYYITAGLVDTTMADRLLGKIEETETILGRCSQKDQMLALLGDLRQEGTYVD